MSKTVEKLIEELNKFPKDANCCAYEGEATGITITRGSKSGFIPCGYEDLDENNVESEYFKKKTGPFEAD